MKSISNNKTLSAVALIAALSLPGAAIAQCLNFSTTMKGGIVGAGAYVLADKTRIRISFEDFYHDPSTVVTTGTTGMTQVTCAGMNEALQLSNRNMRVTILGSAEPIIRASAEICDYGGHENVATDFVVPPKFIGELTDLDRKQLPNAFGRDIETSVPIGYKSTSHYEAKFVMEAPDGLTTFLIGGQEFFVTSVCFN